MSTQKLDYIDALRGIAVIGTILTHCAFFTRGHLPATIHNIVAEGGRGVQLFYVLSAFTLFLTFHKREGHGQNSLRDFALRRIFRIAPMYYVGLAYAAYFFQVSPLHWDAGPANIPAALIINALFLHGFHPNYLNFPLLGGWSVGIEMLFYCIVPFLYKKIRSLNDCISLIIWSVVLNTALTGILALTTPIDNRATWLAYLALYLPSQLPVFACGITAYFIVYTARKSWHVAPWKMHVLLGLLLLQLVTKRFVFFSEDFIYGVIFLGIVVSLSKQRSTLIVNPLTRFIGKISYSAYIIHLPVLYFISQVLASTRVALYPPVAQLLITFGCGLCATTLLSVATYRVVEVPFQTLGKRIIHRRILKVEENAI